MMNSFWATGKPTHNAEYILIIPAIIKPEKEMIGEHCTCAVKQAFWDGNVFILSNGEILKTEMCLWHQMPGVLVKDWTVDGPEFKVYSE